jgi:hypothetical protein
MKHFLLTTIAAVVLVGCGRVTQVGLEFTIVLTGSIFISIADYSVFPFNLTSHE